MLHAAAARTEIVAQRKLWATWREMVMCRSKTTTAPGRRSLLHPILTGWSQHLSLIQVGETEKPRGLGLNFALTMWG